MLGAVASRKSTTALIQKQHQNEETRVSTIRFSKVTRHKGLVWFGHVLENDGSESPKAYWKKKSGIVVASEKLQYRKKKQRYN